MAKTKADYVRTVADAQALMDLIVGGKAEYRWAKNPENLGVLEGKKKQLEAKLNGFGQELVLLDATELRKRYAADRIVTECQNFEKLGVDIGSLAKLTTKVIAMGKTMISGTAAEEGGGLCSAATLPRSARIALEPRMGSLWRGGKWWGGVRVSGAMGLGSGAGALGLCRRGGRWGGTLGGRWVVAMGAAAAMGGRWGARQGAGSTRSEVGGAVGAVGWAGDM